MKKNRFSSHATLVLIAFAAIYFIWGTTYLGMRVAVETMPPFTVSAIRFLFAGTLTFVLLRVRGVASPTFSQWKSAAIIGCFLLIGGNGLTIWALQEIPSGIAAVVVATMPLWMTLFDWLFYAGPRPTIRVVVGLCVGFVGIVLLVRPDQLVYQEQGLHLPSLLALFSAPIFWSIGSLQSRKMDLPRNIFMTTAIQSICGGFGLLFMSGVMGEISSFNLATASTRSMLATLYLTVFGSLIAFTAYSWLLKNVSAARVSSYTFVNPVIAVFLGWLVLGETTSWGTIFAVMLIVIAVVLIVTKAAATRAPSQRIPAESTELLGQDAGRSGLDEVESLPEGTMATNG